MTSIAGGITTTWAHAVANSVASRVKSAAVHDAVVLEVPRERHRGTSAARVLADRALMRPRGVLCSAGSRGRARVTYA